MLYLNCLIIFLCVARAHTCNFTTSIGKNIFAFHLKDFFQPTFAFQLQDFPFQLKDFPFQIQAFPFQHQAFPFQNWDFPFQHKAFINSVIIISFRVSIRCTYLKKTFEIKAFIKNSNLRGSQIGTAAHRLPID